jgi:hypothetical protein
VYGQKVVGLNVIASWIGGYMDAASICPTTFSPANGLFFKFLTSFMGALDSRGELKSPMT